MTPRTGNSFIKCALILFILLPMSSIATLYEDAEDGDTQGNVPPNVRGWFVYDNSPAGAVISNVYDLEKQSKVINFNGPGGTGNGYMLGDFYRNSPGTWNNTSEFNVHWCAKYDSNYVVFMRVYTSINNGTGDGLQRYIYYTASNTNGGLSANRDYIHHGIGTHRANGEWHSINRNLQVDLDDYGIAGNNVVSVVGFLSRGSGRVDDIYLTKDPMSPKFDLTKTSTVISDPVHNTANPKRIPGSIIEYTLKANNTGFGEANSNTISIEDAIPSQLKVCVSNIAQCKTPYMHSNTTLTLGMGAVEYKVGGAWVSNPVADANGFNDSVTHIRVKTTGVFPGYCGTERSFAVKFRASVK